MGSGAGLPDDGPANPWVAPARPRHPPSPIPHHLLAFVRLLRANGIGVSPAETMDAARALAAEPLLLAERAACEAALAGTLVKRAVDRPLFARLFAAYFLGETPLPHDGHDHAHGHARATLVGVDIAGNPERDDGGSSDRHEHGFRLDLRRFFGDVASDGGHEHHPQDRLRLTWLGTETRLARAGAPPPGLADLDGGFALRRLATGGAPGALRPDCGPILPRDVVLPNGHDHHPIPNTMLDPDVAARLAALPARALIRATSPDNPGGGIVRLVGNAALPDLAWDALAVADLVSLERAIARLGRALGGAPGRRQAGRCGRLDTARTMRRAAATDGVPFRPVFRQRTLDRPRLVILLDVSLSVRGAARFLLEVSRAAQRQTGRVRTFAFVRDVVEVTHVLQRGDLASAIAAIFDGRLLDSAEASDAGAA